MATVYVYVYVMGTLADWEIENENFHKGGFWKEQ